MPTHVGTKRQSLFIPGELGPALGYEMTPCFFPQGKVLHHKIEKIEKKVHLPMLFSFGFKTPFFICGKYGDQICKSKDWARFSSYNFYFLRMWKAM